MTGQRTSGAATTGPTVSLQPWYFSHEPEAIGGSLYALPAEHRREAAQLLTEHGSTVHIDMILGRDDRQLGVTPDQLAGLRDTVPDARLDLHLISVGEDSALVAANERQVLELAAQLKAARVTLSAAALARNGAAVQALRDAGVQIWLEIGPDDAVDTTLAARADGALVMLIEPGTTDSADASHLTKIAALPPDWVSGVDGGVTAELARTSLAAGASYVVSGRALLALTDKAAQATAHTDSSSTTE